MNGKSILRAVALTLIGLFFLFPLFWVLLMSFMKNADILRIPPSPFFTPTLHNYAALVSGELVTSVGTQKVTYMLNLFNSTVLSVFSVILSLILGVPAAYAFARYKFRLGEDIAFTLLSFRFAPPLLVLLPLLLYFQTMGLYDTYFGLIWVYQLITLPLVLWIVRGYFEDVSEDIELAYRLDGHSWLSTFFRISIPLARPGIAAAALSELHLRLEQLHLRADPRVVGGPAGDGGGVRLRHRLRHRVRPGRRGAGVFHRADAGAGDVHAALSRRGPQPRRHQGLKERAMAFLEITGLSKSFKHHEVIRDLSIDIEKGEFLVIFGPSGCGKTVLLRLIAGMMQPDAGDIVIDGHSVVDVNPEHRDVGMAFQNYALYPHMTAFENIASPLRARHVTEAEIGLRVNETARMLRIDHVLDHLPKALSQGQKQRTALARSLVGRPGVVLLDDPLRNVDAKIRYEMRFELPRVLRRLRVDRHLRDTGLQGGDGARRPRRGAGGRRLPPGRGAARSLRLAEHDSHCPAVRRSTDQPAAGSPDDRRRRDRDERGGRHGAFAGGPRGRRRTGVHVRHPLREHRRVAGTERRHPGDAGCDHTGEQPPGDAAARQ